MSPASVSTSRASRALETGNAKLWALLVGVNHYQDSRFPALSYSALDCQGLGEAIAAATQPFPHKSIRVHHDFAEANEQLTQTTRYQAPADQVAAAGRLGLETLARLRSFPGEPPTLDAVRASLKAIVAEAQPQDTVLFYFSGHGSLAPDAGQATLCLRDTRKAELQQTGLTMAELLGLLESCAARQQLVWLDACHSGGLSLRVAKGEATPEAMANPTPLLMQILRQRAAQSKGFYALLSCDQEQQSWEFPELGHGVFTYYLIRGLLGEAADEQGVIEADALYKYVYYQTLRYIDKTNQQLRLINQQQRGRGESQMQSEYPLQTPKRIVEGVGELILGLRPPQPQTRHPRQALVVEGLADSVTSLGLSQRLQRSGSFELTYWPQPGLAADALLDTMQAVLLSQLTPAENILASGSSLATALIYLRGQLESAAGGEARLLLRDVAISRTWLRQTLRHSAIAQQVVILDCPGAATADLAEWIDDLQLSHSRGQCLIAAASPRDHPDQFAQVLLDTLDGADPEAGLSIAGWIAQIQGRLAAVQVVPQVWLAATQGVIEVLPGSVGARGDRPQADFDLGLCPYMGLQAFGEADAVYFYGRDALIQQLLNGLQQQPLLAVVGASGSGKSSVVQAGLMAQLRQGKRLPGSDQWWIRSVRPGSRPLDALAQRLVDQGTEREQTYQRQQLEGMLYQGVEGFVRWLRSRPEPMVVLVIDQFEELFTLATPEDRQRLLDLLLGAVEHAGDRFRLVITLRTDFITPCLELPPLAAALQHNSILVPPYLQDDDYRQIIVRPAERVGLTVDPELVEVLLQELSRGAGDLPLLEFVLQQIWQHRQPGCLTLQVYQQQIGGLKGALERTAQAVYESLDDDAQRCARWIFLALTQLGDQVEDTRRRVPKAALVVGKYPADLVERTLQALIAAKLVVVSLDEAELRDAASRSGNDPEPGKPDESAPFLPSDREPMVEVAHEVLIRHWSTLRWWLQENRARLHTQRQIEQAVAAWRQSGEQPDFVLRGMRLEAAEELYVKYTDELSQEVQRFIEAGLDARQQAQQQAQQRLRQARRAIALISTLAIVAIGLGGIAYSQQQQAQWREIEALNALSDAQLRSQRGLEALLTSLRAGRQMAQLRSWGWGQSRVALLQVQTAATVQQAVSLGRERQRLEGHDQAVTSVDVSPDGQRLATASDDGTVHLWTAAGESVQVLPGPDERVTAVRFSPDGNWLAAAGAEGTVSLWQLAALELAPTQTWQHGDWVTSMAWQSGGQQLATAGRDGRVNVWQIATGQLQRTLTVPGGWVNGVGISANGQTLATAGEDGVVRLWSGHNGTAGQTLAISASRITDLQFSPDDTQMAIAAGDGSLTLWQIGEGTRQTLLGHQDQVNSVVFSPDGQQIVSASSDRTLRRWRVADGMSLETLAGHGDGVLSARFTPDGQTLISGSADHSVRLWAVVPPLQTLSAHSARFSPDGESFAVAGWDGPIQLWRRDGDDSGLLFKTLEAGTDPIFALTFSADGQQLATAGADSTIQLWQPQTGARGHTLTGHSDSITALAFSPDSQILASGSDDRTVRLWNAAAGSLEQTLSGHGDGVTAVAFSPNGDRLASGSYDRTIKLWQPDGTLLQTLEGHGLAIAAVTFSPNGQILASASWDNTIRLWRSTDGRLLRTLTGHQGGVTSLAFSPRGQILASGSADHTIRLWDAATGTLLNTMAGQPDSVLSLQFSPDGQTLISASEALGARLWSLDLPDLLLQTCDRLTAYLQTSPSLPEGDRHLCPPKVSAVVD